MSQENGGLKEYSKLQNQNPYPDIVDLSDADPVLKGFIHNLWSKEVELKSQKEKLQKRLKETESELKKLNSLKSYLQSNLNNGHKAELSLFIESLKGLID